MAEKELFKVDAIDRKLLMELNREVRAPLAQLARRIRSSKEVTRYRLLRLERAGVIKQYATIFGMGYWAYKTVLRFQRIDARQEERIIKELAAHPRTNFLTQCSGDWDAVVALMAKDPADLNEVLDDVRRIVGDALGDLQSAVSVGGHTYGHTYLLPHVREAPAAKRRSDIAIDDIDRAICREIRQDARRKITDIASSTGVPAETVRNRIRRLQERGIIKRYRLILDSSRLGFQRYEIFVRGTPLTRTARAAFIAFGQEHPAIEYLGSYVGAWDFTITAHVRTPEEFRALLQELRAKLGAHIRDMTSVTLFSTLNYTYLPDELLDSAVSGSSRSHARGRS